MMDTMMDTGGRTSSFMAGASRPPIPATPFRPTSVLDKSQVMKSPNGLSATDLARQPIKGPGISLNGMSVDTLNARQWIGSGYRTFGE